MVWQRRGGLRIELPEPPFLVQQLQIQDLLEGNPRALGDAAKFIDQMRGVILEALEEVGP